MAVTRRSHKKSRYGCFTCKSRRIKCDENHPTCHNCSRKSLNCSYPELSIPSSSEREPTNSPNHHSPNFLSSVNISSVGSPNGKEIQLPDYSSASAITYELIDFSFNHLYSYLSTHVTEREMWAENIKKLFFNQVGLYHILMATSSIFKYYENVIENKKYYSVSRFHYTKCLENFQQSLNGNAHDISLASMFTSGLVTLYLAASYDYKVCQPTFFKIGRGTRAVYSVGKEELSKILVPEIRKKYHPIKYEQFKGYTFPEYLVELLDIKPFDKLITNDEDEDKFDFMGMTPCITTSNNRKQLKYHQIYLDTINVLYNQYVHTHDPTKPDLDYFPIITRWSVSVPDEFTYLLSKNDPRALIMVSFLLRLLVTLKSTWFKVAALDEIRYIENVLPRDWFEWLMDNLAAHNKNYNANDSQSLPTDKKDVEEEKNVNHNISVLDATDLNSKAILKNESITEQ